MFSCLGNPHHTQNHVAEHNYLYGKLETVLLVNWFIPSNQLWEGWKSILSFFVFMLIYFFQRRSWVYFGPSLSKLSLICSGTEHDSHKADEGYQIEGYVKNSYLTEIWDNEDVIQSLGWQSWDPGSWSLGVGSHCLSSFLCLWSDVVRNPPVLSDGFGLTVQCHVSHP